MNHDPTPPNDDAPDATPQLPAELVDALRGLDGPAVPPSAAHDAALLSGAREHLAGLPELPGVGIAQVERRGRSRHVLAFIGAGGAVAAAAAVTFAVIVGQDDHKQHPASPAVAQHDADSRRPTDAGRAAPPGDARIPGDLDHSGTLDILDAFALARVVERSGGDPLSRDIDFNGDGTVDAQDADWLAQRAVTVRRDGGQG